MAFLSWQWAVAVGRVESQKDEIRKLKKVSSGQFQFAECKGLK